MKIVFMGTPEFAVESLKRLIESGYEVVGVVTVPDKPAGRGLKMQQSAVKEYATAMDLRVLQPVKLRDPEWIEEFRALGADLAVVVAFRMLPEMIWAMPPLGTFNLHSSLLPKYRGAAPINWAIINGETESGVTTFMLNHQIDCGDIIEQRRVEITSEMNAGELHDKLMVVGADLVVDTVKKIEQGRVVFHRQNGESTQAPKIFKDDCKIDFSMGSREIYDKIRGLSPYPTAWCEIGSTTAKIYAAKYVIENHSITSGCYETDNKTFLRFASSDGWIYANNIQVAGKKAMPIEDFLRGFKL